MGKTEASNASQLILQTLQESSRTKKELKKAIKAARPSMKKKYTKRALKDLVASGTIKKKGKEYKLAKKNAPAPATTSLPKSILSSKKQENKSSIPIGMKLRESGPKKGVRFNEEKIDDSSGDIDDEIARLEKELMNDSDDDSGNSSEEDDDSNASPTANNGVLSLSAYADDRVETLPSACLPVPGKYSLTKKKGGKSKSPQQPEVKSGLQKAVEEVLGGYQARSSERIPFYCRFCAKQYENKEAFFEHKNTEFHKTAVAMEKKATYCKLCRKQFTSPTQMKDHLSSRPHKEKLQFVRNRQQGFRGRR